MILLLFACKATVPAELLPLDGDGPPAAEIRWHTETATVQHLEYSYRKGVTQSSRPDPEPTTDHQFLLVGVPPATQVSWRIVSEDGEETPWETWQTPERELPAEPPKIRKSTSIDPGYFGMTDVTDHIIWIVGSDGNPVWWQYLPEALVLERLRLLGNDLWFSYNLNDQDIGDAFIGSVGLDGSDLQTSLVQHHHDFLVFPDRLVVIRRIAEEGPDGEALAGDELVELSGTEEKVLWTSMTGGASLEVDYGKEYAEGHDWTHCNGLFFEETTDAYWLSCKVQEALFVIARSGERLHILGGANSTWTPIGDSFGKVHAPFLQENRLYIYNNSRKRGEVYTLDREQQSYTLATSHRFGNVGTEVHGNVTPTQRGGMMVAYGFTGLVEAVNADGDTEMAVETKEMSYADYFPALSGPIP